MKDDEKEFLRAMQQRCQAVTGGKARPGEMAHTIMDDFPNIHRKRLQYILYKWTKKDWYNYGVGVEYGWMEDKGLSIDTGTGTTP